MGDDLYDLWHTVDLKQFAVIAVTDKEWLKTVRGHRWVMAMAARPKAECYQTAMTIANEEIQYHTDELEFWLKKRGHLLDTCLKEGIEL
jgi:hypothetical protein